MDYSTHDDQERQWILSARGGDREAFDALIDLHGRSVLRYLQNMCQCQADAEDLAQETLYQAYRRLNTFQEGTNFRSWLLTIAYHGWVHSKRRKRASERTSDTLDRVAHEQPQSDDVTGGETVEAIQKCLARLPEEQRTVALLRFGEGMSHAEIAEITKADPTTVRWRLFRARQTLRRVLAAWLPESKQVRK